MTTPIDIRADHLRIVQDVLRRHLPDGVKVWVFGSRATWATKDSSDLDLALEGDGAIPARSLAALEAAFEDSDLPYVVDVVDVKRIGESFRRIVMEQRVPLPGSARHSRLNETIDHARNDLSPDVETHAGWRRRDVRALIRDRVLVVGDGHRAKNNELSSSGLPFARAGNIADGFRFSAADRFPEDQLRRVGDKTSRPGDVVFTSKGTVGRFAYVHRDTEPFVYSPQLCFWRSLDPEVIDPHFLYCWVRGPEFFRQFKSVAGETDMAEYVSLTDQRRMFITLPPLLQQRAIAHVLGTLDDKIELNRRVNATLEAMARALFRSWFVDFDPVRAKTKGRDTGLPKEVADLFPDRLVDSSMGQIPEGWSVEELSEHFEAVKGVSYKGSGLTGEGVPLHNLNSICEGGGYKYDGIKFYSGEYAARHVVRPGDVIVANTEQGHHRLLVGYAAIVPGHLGDHGIASHHLYRIRARPTGRLPTVFLHSLLNTPRMHDVVSRYANGTTVNMLPLDALRKPEITVPPRTLVDYFDRLALWVEHRREQAVCESHSLSVLRDALLPKLVSGRMRARKATRPRGAVE